MPFPETERFKKSVEEINGISASRLPKLISRIGQKCGTDDESPFTDEEKEKLCEVLELGPNSLQSVLETLELILRQAAYHNWKLSALMQHLNSANLEQERGEIVSQAWQKYGKEIIARLKKNNLSANQLEKVGWHLNLQVAQDSKSKMAEPNVVFQLECKDANGEANNMLLEFNHDELLEFYKKLETIQEQMDALS